MSDSNVVGVREYYKLMQTSFDLALQKIDKQIEDIEEDCVGLRDKVACFADKLLIDVRDYKEFKEDRYINGKLFRVLSTMVHDTFLKPEIKIYAIMIYSYAAKRKAQFELARRKGSYEKALSLSFKEYKKIIKTYYFKVQSFLLDGYGYLTCSGLGWVCFNRVYIRDDRKVLDFAATNANKKKLLLEGKTLFNKYDYDKAAAEGKPYDGIDYRIYKNDEFVYEFPLIRAMIDKGFLKIRLLNSRNKKYQIPNSKLLEITGGDCNKIKALDVDLKTKLTLCLQSDKLLYTKFIRNEEQTSYKHRKTYLKDR